ncbi:MAG: 30S ribosomal protein S16 [Candidatus Nomurabacteria bacterium]|nr:30S ribosomal protein S16 [Candidatus Nomurabacteria bacterium]
MLKIRLQRIGRRHDPHFRMVVVDSRQGPKSGKFVAKVGSYNAKLGDIQIDAEAAKKYLDTGAQPSDTVYNMLVTHGILKGKKKNVLPKKTPIVKEVAETAAEPAKAKEAPAVEAPATEAPVEAPAAEPAAEIESTEE